MVLIFNMTDQIPTSWEKQEPQSKNEFKNKIQKPNISFKISENLKRGLIYGGIVLGILLLVFGSFLFYF